jgi:geranylgeranyl pyrophosphate synthase
VNSPQAQLAPVLAAGGPELARLLERTEARLAEVAAGHGPDLGRHADGTLAAGGKRLRPVLVYLCAGAEARATHDEELLAAAAAVELLHMATLVHDDVLDGASLRRGRPTVYAEGGRLAATATGDFLFSRAFAELAFAARGEASPAAGFTGAAPSAARGSSACARAVRALSRASSALARGELMQRADAWSPTVTRERYLERCRLKTGSLFEASCRLGALLGGEARLADGLGHFGEDVGVAFQLLDDVLDVSGPAERTGKPRGADLLDGTVTLPLIIARERDSGLAALDLRARVATPGAAADICDRIVATGALVDARAEALELVADAKATLAALQLEPERSRALELVADGVVDRYA